MDASVATLLHTAGTRLAKTSATPHLDAECLLAHALQTRRSHLFAHPEQCVERDTLRRFARLVGARSQGRPVAYLTGEREFWSLSLKVNPATLIPRPETELLLEQTLYFVPTAARWQLLDLGTGSGAIALALAKERPHCRITATDISRPALAVAGKNAAALGIANVEFLQGEWFAPLPGRRYRVIVSNPPYVPDGDPHLDTGDLRFEPQRALNGGPDGLAMIRKIVQQAPAHLDPGGMLMLEHGNDQATRVRDLLSAAGFSGIQTFRDLAGTERASTGRFAD
ncbi:MAG: peptide chain release factor N(5)-glutamine methyltransferase [Gammaproteobacteria bacterium]|nr:peptide chain release factor N(5)-glutamine methyltransferase [Gammaproteobacteria bacterium]